MPCIFLVVQMACPIALHGISPNCGYFGAGYQSITWMDEAMKWFGFSPFKRVHNNTHFTREWVTVYSSHCCFEVDHKELEVLDVWAVLEEAETTQTFQTSEHLVIKRLCHQLLPPRFSLLSCHSWPCLLPLEIFLVLFLGESDQPIQLLCLEIWFHLTSHWQSSIITPSKSERARSASPELLNSTIANPARDDVNICSHMLQKCMISSPYRTNMLRYRTCMYFILVNDTAFLWIVFGKCLTQHGILDMGGDIVDDQRGCVPNGIHRHREWYWSTQWVNVELSSVDDVVGLVGVREDQNP